MTSFTHRDAIAYMGRTYSNRYHIPFVSLVSEIFLLFVACMNDVLVVPSLDPKQTKSYIFFMIRALMLHFPLGKFNLETF